MRLRAPSPWFPRSVVALAFGLVALLGCGPGPTSPAPISSAAVTASELERARAFRVAFGLRADEAWIGFVSNDPAADRSYGIALSPVERRELEARASLAEDVLAVVERYGRAHPDEWAGGYVDNARGSVVVARFVGDLEGHRRAIGALLSPAARWEVASGRWTLIELRSLQDRIATDEGFVRSLGARLTSHAVDIRRNAVVVWVESTSPLPIDVVAHHYGAEPVQLVLETAPPPWSGGFGEILVIARPVGDARVVDLEVVLRTADPSAVWNPGVGIGTDAEGRALLREVPAVRHDVVLLAGEAGRLVEVGRASVDVAAGGLTVVEVVVRDP